MFSTCKFFGGPITKSLLAILFLINFHGRILSPAHAQWRWKSKIFSISCQNLEKDFYDILEKMDQTKVKGQDLHSIRQKYNQKMSIHLAYEGIKKLKSNYLGQMMSYENDGDTEDKLGVMMNVLNSTAQLKAFKGLLEKIEYDDSGTVKTFDLGEYLQSNPTATAREFQDHLHTVCTNSSSDLCQSLNNPTSREGVKNLVARFFQISQLGDFTPQILDDFQKYFKSEVSHFFPTPPKVVITEKLAEKLQELKKCQASSSTSKACSELQLNITYLEEEIGKIKSELEGEFTRDNIRNFASSLDNMMKFEKMGLDSEPFYRSYDNVMKEHYREKIRGVKDEIQAKLEYFCGNVHNVDMKKYQCKKGPIKDKDQIQAINDLKLKLDGKDEAPGLVQKLKDGKFSGHWQNSKELSSAGKKKFDLAINSIFTDPSSRDHWNTFQMAGSPSCTKLFYDPNAGTFDDCANTPPISDLPNRNDIKAAFERYKTQWNTDPQFKVAVEDMQSPIKIMARDFLSILFKDSESSANIPPECSSLRDGENKVKKMQDLSFPDVVECLSKIDNQFIDSKDSDVLRELDQLASTLHAHEKSPQIQDYFRMLKRIAQGLAMEKCGTENAIASLEEAFLLDCHHTNLMPGLLGETEPIKSIGSILRKSAPISANRFLDHVKVDTQKIEEGKKKVPQEKWLAGLAPTYDGTSPDIYQKYENRYAQEKVYKEMARKETPSLLPYGIMGGALAVPYAMQVGLGYMQNQQMISMLTHYSTQAIWQQHYMRMAGASMGLPFSMGSGGYRGFGGLQSYR